MVVSRNINRVPILEYIDQNTAAACPVTGVNLIDLHNAMSSIIRCRLSDVVDITEVDDWSAIWNIKTEAKFAVTNKNMFTSLVDEPTVTLPMVRFQITSQGRVKHAYYLPPDDKLIGPGHIKDLTVPILQNKPWTPEQLFDKWKPIKEASTGYMQNPEEEGNSMVAVARAAHLVEGTIRRELEVDAPTAKEFAEEFAKDLARDNRLTPEFMGSGVFYQLALRTFSRSV